MCSVQFGSGAEVEEVITPFESRRVLLSNLPASTTEADVIALVSTIADSASVLLHRSATHHFPTATVEFPDRTQAARAVPSLDNQHIDGRKVAARLDLRARAAESGTGSILSCKVKLNWFAPSCSAFAQYSSAEVAERQAERLTGMTFEGHRLRATFRKPLRRRIRDSSAWC